MAWYYLNMKESLFGNRRRPLTLHKECEVKTADLIRYVENRALLMGENR
jgi:hypothetical protein